MLTLLDSICGNIGGGSQNLVSVTSAEEILGIIGEPTATLQHDTQCKIYFHYCW